MAQDKKKKRNIRRPLVMGLVMTAVLIVDVGLFAMAAIRYVYSRTNYVEDDAVTVNFGEMPNRADDPYADDKGIWQEMESEEEYSTMDAAKAESLLAIFEGKNEEETEEESGSDTGILPAGADSTYNLLLLGADKAHTETGWYGNSDVIILLTFNDAKKTIYMTSFMRDLFANIPGFGGSKINNAYARGGGPLAVDTLRDNYGVRIDNYAALDYTSTAAIIDMFGGVDVIVDSAEANYAYLPSNGDNVPTHLDGTQAVNYARIRHIGNADYGRTERQREVLTNLYQRMRSMGVLDWVAIGDYILPLITHNVSRETFTYLVTKAPVWLNYDLVQLRVPFDGHYGTSNEMLVPDVSYTINTLFETIY